jgi:hypothetical protein
MIGAAATLLLGGLAVWRAGILGPMVNDAFLYDLGYVGHGNGGSVPWLLGLKLLSLLVATVALKRAPLFYLWSVWVTVGALFSGRVFGHYTLQTVVPLAISGAMLLRRYTGPRLLIALPCGFLACGIVTAVAGWSVAATGHDSILARRLQYYANFGRYALRTESYMQYESGLDDHVARNHRVASSLTSLPSGKLLVWGNTPWIYVLSGRLPATPYTSSVRQPAVPGETEALRRSLRRDVPAVVVLIGPPSPPVGAAWSALRHHYRIRGQVGNATIYERALSP